MQQRWDIFCSVVDNYGDIGVTWRLARQLVAEHRLAVRLWVDDLQAFTRLCPMARADVFSQWQEGVEVCRWQADWPDTPPADVVIGAFACQLPGAYVEAMNRMPAKPLWLNLEYLSAEDWVPGCHGLPSPQPGGLNKLFFFPGFVDNTGGLLREHDLVARRRAFQADPQARAAFLAQLGVVLPADTCLLSLFAYENPGVSEWLDALASAPQASHLLVPEGRVLADVRAWLGVPTLTVGAVHTRGCLTVQVVPFVSQDDYDRLLWCCDFNAVRGEDSFVRAQWAGRPMVWHIYPQEEAVHLVKLEAFLQLYSETLSAPARQALQGFWLAWNLGEGIGAHWQGLQAHAAELRDHAERWCDKQAERVDLAMALVQL